MKDQTREEPKIIAAAEKQMRSYATAQELADRTVRLDQGGRPSSELGDFITISREAGVGGEEIAQLVGKKLSWQVLAKELLEMVAERYRLSRSMLELVDETTTNWAFDILGEWMDHTIIPREKYLVHLTRIALAAAKEGNVIFVGRGVTFLLPPGQGLAVRLIAPEKYRVNQIMQRDQVKESKARKTVRDLDRGRRDFVQGFFGNDVNDPHLYDLVVNVERLGPDSAAELIVDTFRRFRSRASD